MGSYVGTAVLRGDNDDKLADVRVTLARADVSGDRWFGSVQGLDPTIPDLDGLEVVVELPAGLRGRARVVLDITGDVPLVRLVGMGAAPV